MNETDYQDITEKTFQKIEAFLDEADEDLDYSSPSTGILEIELDDGRKVIINRHQASQEIWVAATTGAHHFKWEDGSWLDTRSRAELFSEIARLIK